MAEGAAARALRESLKALEPVERDRAAVALAKRYAVLLDAAAVASSYRPALERLEQLVESPADRRALAKIRDALGAHSVASDLGPKFLAVLDRLGLTPAARGARAALPPAAAPESDPAPEPEPAPEGTTDELRRRRAERAAKHAADPR